MDASPAAAPAGVKRARVAAPAAREAASEAAALEELPSLLHTTPKKLCEHAEADARMASAIVPAGESVNVRVSPVEQGTGRSVWQHAGSFPVQGPATLGEVMKMWADEAPLAYLHGIREEQALVHLCGFGRVPDTDEAAFFVRGRPAVLGDRQGALFNEPELRDLPHALDTAAQRMKKKATATAGWCNLSTISHDGVQHREAVQKAEPCLRRRGLWDQTAPWSSFTGWAALVRMVPGYECRQNEKKQHEFRKMV